MGLASKINLAANVVHGASLMLPKPNLSAVDTIPDGNIRTGMFNDKAFSASCLLRILVLVASFDELKSMGSKCGAIVTSWQSIELSIIRRSPRTCAAISHRMIPSITPKGWLATKRRGPVLGMLSNFSLLSSTLILASFKASPKNFLISMKQFHM